jgi:hypothetical protein
MVTVYLGDTMNSRSQSEVVLQEVLQTTSVATITSSTNPSSPGQAGTFTGKITSPTVRVTGPVTFAAGNIILRTAQLSRGTAALTTSELPIGSTRVQVTYHGTPTSPKVRLHFCKPYSKSQKRDASLWPPLSIEFASSA